MTHNPAWNLTDIRRLTVRDRRYWRDWFRYVTEMKIKESSSG